MQTPDTAWLQSIPSLSEVPAPQLQWLIDNSSWHELPEESYLFKLGEPIQGTFIIGGGKVRVFHNQKSGTRIIGYFEENDVTGYLPFSRATVGSVNGQVIQT